MKQINPESVCRARSIAARRGIVRLSVLDKLLPRTGASMDTNQNAQEMSFPVLNDAIDIQKILLQQ
jgi:hypothetical protein